MIPASSYQFNNYRKLHTYNPNDRPFDNLGIPNNFNQQIVQKQKKKRFNYLNSQSFNQLQINIPQPIQPSKQINVDSNYQQILKKRPKYGSLDSLQYLKKAGKYVRQELNIPLRKETSLQKYQYLNTRQNNDLNNGILVERNKYLGNLNSPKPTYGSSELLKNYKIPLQRHRKTYLGYQIHQQQSLNLLQKKAPLRQFDKYWERKNYGKYNKNQTIRSGLLNKFPKNGIKSLFSNIQVAMTQSIIQGPFLR